MCCSRSWFSRTASSSMGTSEQTGCFRHVWYRVSLQTVCSRAQDKGQTRHSHMKLWFLVTTFTCWWEAAASGQGSGGRSRKLLCGGRRKTLRAGGSERPAGKQPVPEAHAVQQLVAAALQGVVQVFDDAPHVVVYAPGVSW